MTVNDFQETLDGGLFGLPPDHIVVALRGRTGHEHLGWRKPGEAERLRCAALLASDAFRVGRVCCTPPDALNDAELSVLLPPAGRVGAARIRGLVQQLERDPAALNGSDIMADVQAVEELQSWLSATQAARLHRLAEPGCAGDPSALAYAAARLDPDLSDAEPDSPHWNYAGIQLAVGHLGAALCISPITAGYRISDAQDLLVNVPLLHDALRDGAIDPARARILQQRTKVLQYLDERRNVVAAMLPIAMHHNPGRFAALVDAAVIDTDLDAAEQRRLDALDRRGLKVDALEDGLARFVATLPATEAQLAWDLFDSIGQALKGFDDRCADHRRADAFTTMIELLASGHTVSAQSLLDQVLTAPCTCPPGESCPTPAPSADEPASAASGDATGPVEPADAGEAGGKTDTAGRADASDPVEETGTPEWTDSADPSGPATVSDHGVRSDSGDVADLRDGAGCHGSRKQWSLPTRQGRRTHATIVLPWDVFSGPPGGVAELADHGMISAGWARTLLEAAATVTLLVTDPATGRSVAVSDRTYRPTQDVRDKVTTAYPTCIFTGCGRASKQCDCEHCERFDHHHPDRGGATDTGNLFPVCRLHHRLKTFADWDYRAQRDGIHVISPLGQVTVTHPANRPTAWPPSSGDGPPHGDDPAPF